MKWINKTIFITGASSGLGRNLAIHLSLQGANLALMARNSAGLYETAKCCSGTPLLLSGDITSEIDCLNGIKKAISQFGRLDYLVLNAGISMWSTFENLADLSVIYQLMETNFFGAVRCTHFALPYLIKSQGMIVVISSIQGKLSTPYHSGYAASKHALEGFFNSLRMELKKDKIKILSVYPGWIKNTELKNRALPQKSVITENIRSKHNRQALSIEYCTNEIIHAMVNRKEQLILPKKYRFALWLQLISPRLFDFLIMRAV